MMFKSKRAQAAMEFLMTYGWALLVVLIAIAALAFFGLLNPSRFLPEKCTVPPGLGCGGYAAVSNNANNFSLGATTGTHLYNQTSNLTFYLTNGMGESMYNLTVNIPECVNDARVKAHSSIEQRAPIYMTNNTTSPYYGNATPLSAVNLNEGETVQLGLGCTVQNSLVAGNRFRGAMNISYFTRFENTLQQRIKSGDLIVAVQ